MVIDTDTFSRKFRDRSIIQSEKKILIARLTGSEQEQDLSHPVNCNGFGRIRHFRLQTSSDWSPNPLPIYPAAKALNQNLGVGIQAQVFQNAACNWRCWYCFVDFDRLSANRHVSEYFTCDELLDLYLQIPKANRPSIIDLSGGQPDLVPEWTVWMLEAIHSRDLQQEIFLWSDDNLSNYYHWEYLSLEQQRTLIDSPMYARVGCFKGFNRKSFSFNTMADPILFDQQFDIFQRLVEDGLDIYAYVTFTGIPDSLFRQGISNFVDKLQDIHPNLPLRTIPLEVQIFTPSRSRIKSEHLQAMEFQYEVHAAWIDELSLRFTDELRNVPISDVKIN